MPTISTIDHAVVLGGSMTGMLAAAALARHARRVTVIDRDELDDAPHHRKGTPQDHQAHILLDRGRLAIEHLMPGLFDELLEHGSRRIDFGQELWWYHYGRWKIRCDTPYRLYVQTRPLLEHHVRRRLRASSNVELRSQTEVLEPVIVDGHVRGVRLRSRQPSAPLELPCDVILDATGRGSRSPQWLEPLGFGSPREERIPLGLAYASRLYRRPPSAPSEWSAYIVYATRPAQRRHGLLFAVEDDGWLLALSGYGGDHPPDDPEGFEAWAGSLDRPDLRDFIREAEPLTKPRLHAFPFMRWRHYEELRLPMGYGVVGDAMCSFDPVFGQGMTAGAMEAEQLERMLASGRGFDSTSFARACARIAKNPWTLALGEAARYATAETSIPALPLLHRFLDRVFACSTSDPVVYRAFLDVLQLHAGPESLFRPHLLWRLARGKPAEVGAAAPMRHPG
ncbi:NAD(P)/FAD-dependent oxidoreductase [Paraliomyxa miuraensis]|uniref:NAD(P)/FAD-dependent oxidoreductase n=1 Tax=Paraliomyxa miuraensis TaxID=376150 RepID=UPI00225AF3EB|nr:hypothetical protein [Paraliomyxa miuraensis]MCX4246528.1 hypothetical protein [Paraliomyxa miuraensis]